MQTVWSLYSQYNDGTGAVSGTRYIRGLVYAPNAGTPRFYVLYRQTEQVFGSYTRYEYVDTYNTSWVKQNGSTPYQAAIDTGNDNGWGTECLGWDHVSSRLMYAYYTGSAVQIFALTMNGSFQPTGTASTWTVTGSSGYTNVGFVTRINDMDGDATDRLIFKNRFGTSGANSRFTVVNASTSAILTSYNWPAAADSGGSALASYGAYFDSTAKKVYGVSAGPKVVEYQGDDSYWSGTDYTRRRWVGYSWYTTIGGTKETSLGPTAGIDTYKRARVKVTISTIPTSQDVQSAKVYMATNSTSPELTTPSALWKQRATITSGVSGILLPMTSAALSSAASPKAIGASTFGAVAADAAKIISSDGTSLILKGDGSGKVGPWTFNAAGTITANLIDTGWITFASIGFGSGWQAGDTTPSYRKIDNIVYLRGCVERASGTGTTAFTFPSGFRPTQNNQYWLRNTVVATAPTASVITTAGALGFSNAATASGGIGASGASNSYALDGIAFFVN